MYENLIGKRESIIMIKGEYNTSVCIIYIHIVIADRFKIQPYIYIIPSFDILLRTKQSVLYRYEDGKPDPIGCFLLYVMLRHNCMINTANIKRSCDSVLKDARCGWKQAVTGITCFERRIRLQKYPSPSKRLALHDKDDQEKEMKILD